MQQAKHRAALLRELAALGRPISLNADPTVLAAVTGTNITAGTLQRALTSVGIVEGRLLFFGQKAELVNYLAYVEGIRVPRTPMIIDVARRTRLPGFVPLVAIARAFPESSSDSEVPVELVSEAPTATLKETSVRLRPLVPGRVLESNGPNGHISTYRCVYYAWLFTKGFMRLCVGSKQLQATIQFFAVSAGRIQATEVCPWSGRYASSGLGVTLTCTLGVTVQVRAMDWGTMTTCSTTDIMWHVQGMTSDCGLCTFGVLKLYCPYIHVIKSAVTCK
jgi:hypothetical protein